MDIRELIDGHPVDRGSTVAGNVTGYVEQDEQKSAAQRDASPAPDIRVPLKKHTATDADPDADPYADAHRDADATALGRLERPSHSHPAATASSSSCASRFIHSKPAETTQQEDSQPGVGIASSSPSLLPPSGGLNQSRATGPADTRPASVSDSHHDRQLQQTDSDAASVGAPSSFSVGLSIDTDESSSDADSAVGSMRAQSSSMSASSSIFDFVEAHGRTWHRYHEGKYFMPNDIPEQERLDLQHSISVRLFGGLYLAPVDRPARVLDIGTGTGIWAIEFANEHPESDVLGTDLSPIQPEYVPPNCRFEVDDAEDDWVFSYPFDYIHSRYMSGSISNFPDLFRMCLDNLNPGGWIEFQDYYVRLQAMDESLVGTALERWNECVIEGVKRMGKNALACAKYKTQMEDAGFVSVTERKFALPGNPWAKGEDQKILGTMQMENILDGLHGFSIGLFTKMLGMSAEEVELMLVDVRKDLRNTKIHFYYVVYSVYARKPL